MRVLYFAQEDLWETARLRVTYNASLGYRNEVDCSDLADFRKSLALFTEPYFAEFGE
jgi:hypothetical protein